MLDAPILGIVNDTDSPQNDMVVVIYNGETHYIAKKRKYKFTKNNRYSNFTTLDKFGKRPVFTKDGYLKMEDIGECVAKYEDGMPRKWQDNWNPPIEVKGSVMRYVFCAVHALHEAKMEDTPHA